MVKIVFELTEDQADDFAQLVKRLARRNLDSRDLGLVTEHEIDGAETAVYALQAALTQAGFDPR